MKTKKEKSLKPSAFICSATDRGRKQQKNNKVFLADNEAFCLELHNPLEDNVLCMIHIDNEPISESGVLLKKNQRIYLDSFIESKKKFLYKHVECGDGEGTTSKTKNKIEVHFYNEKVDVSDLLLKLHTVREDEREKERARKEQEDWFKLIGGTGNGTWATNPVWISPTIYPTTTHTINYPYFNTNNGYYDTNVVFGNNTAIGGINLTNGSTSTPIKISNTLSTTTGTTANISTLNGTSNSNPIDTSGTVVNTLSYNGLSPAQYSSFHTSSLHYDPNHNEVMAKLNGIIAEGDLSNTKYDLKENNIEEDEIDTYFICKAEFNLYPEKMKPLTKKEVEDTFVLNTKKVDKISQLKDLKELYDAKFLSLKEMELLKNEIIGK